MQLLGLDKKAVKLMQRLTLVSMGNKTGHDPVKQNEYL